jgi:hypothetical protein
LLRLDSITPESALVISARIVTGIIRKSGGMMQLYLNCGAATVTKRQWR